jgi:epoxyqueuosine reductase
MRTPPPTPPDETPHSDDSVLPPGAARHVPPPEGVPALNGGELADAIRGAALELGFARVGFCPIEPFEAGGRALRDWLAAGHHGEMAYLAGEPRADPRALLPEARSLVVVALPYGRDVPAPARSQGEPVPLSGRIARYALGADYHGLLKERLRRLADRCASFVGRPVLARPCVDTAPLLEREAARRSGIGFTAKSTMTIAPGLGSYVLLGELLLDVELAPGAPIAPSCGACRSCLDACPTGAFVDAYTLDARRCISYLTIELRGAIPLPLRPMIGRWVFGCDVCQEVCPFNHSRHPRPGDPELQAKPRLSDVDLLGLLALTSKGHRRFVRGTALHRVSRRRLQRNAAVALGNTRNPDAVPPLLRQLTTSESVLVRGHCAWALGQIGTSEARAGLSARREVETDASVIAEIDAAILSHENAAL